MYFTWQHYGFRRPPEMHGERGAHPVVIVGAGPIGLTLALELKYRGVPVVLLERRDTVSDGSRSAGIRPRSMQIFDRLGVAQAMLAKAVVFDKGWVFYGNRLVNEMSIRARPTQKHADLLLLQQCWIEQILVDRALQMGVDLRWSSTVVGIEAGQDEVRLEIETPEGRYPLRGKYVVATDGAHSDMRRMLGLRYEGVSFEQRWVIADFHMPSPLPVGRRLWFDPPYKPGSTTIMHRMPFDVWRLDYLVPDDEDVAEAAQPERAKARIAAHLRMMGIDTRWTFILSSVYRPNALSMADYRHGRVFFAGDAAHLIPIFSGRGMNHGIEDAHNLAWKLAGVLQGWASTTTLDSYTAERRAAVTATIRELTKTTLYMNSSSRSARLMRDAVLSLSLSHEFARKLFEPFSIMDVPYLDSPLNATESEEESFSSGPSAGALLPDFPVRSPSGVSGAIFDHLGKGFTGLYVATRERKTEDLRTLSQALRFAVDFKMITLSANPDPVKTDALVDCEGLAPELLDAAPGTFYLIRPDDIVAGRWRNANLQVVAKALQTAVGRQK